MKHLSDGALRRMHDEPLAMASRQREHFETCEHCRQRFASIVDSAVQSADLLTVPTIQVETQPALSRLQARFAAEGTRPAGHWQRTVSSWLQRRMIRPAAAAALVVAILGSLTLTPAGSLAQSFITVFQPKQVVAVPISRGELRGLPNLSKWGTLHAPRNLGVETVTDATAAARAAGMQVLSPSTLPASVPSSVTYRIYPGGSGSFTFSAAKAQQWAARHGKQLPTMPPGLDGSTLHVQVGSAVVAVYGDKTGVIPSLVIGQMKAPVVSSNGVSAREIESYVLSLPGISPQLAAAVQAIGDPTSTLPIPIPLNRAHEQSVTVQGVHGVLIGDASGMGSLVIWQKGDVIYGVGGTLTSDQVTALANSLR